MAAIYKSGKNVAGPKLFTCMDGSFTNFVNGNGQDITQS